MNVLDLNKFIDAVGNKHTTRDEIIGTLKHHLTYKSGRRTIAETGITTQDKARRILQEFRLWRDEYSTPYSDDYVLQLVVSADNATLPFIPTESYTAIIERNRGSVLTPEQVAEMNVAGLRGAEAGKLFNTKLALDTQVNKIDIQVRQGSDVDSVARSVAAAFNRSAATVKSELVNSLAQLAAWPVTEASNTTQEPVTIQGATADYNVDLDAIKRRALDMQKKADAKHAAKQGQTIRMNDGKPFAIAYLSDFHIGSSGTNYKALFDDIDTIDRTDGFYSGFHGDAVDNWIVGKLQGLQRGQALNFDEEWQLFLALLEQMKRKLLWVVSGNHDMWSFKVSGLDRIRQALQGTKLLYDTDEVCVTVHLGDASWRHKIRHKWRYNSIFNKSHPIERDLERGGDDFDIAVAGHTHIGTYFREFSFHNKMRLAILTGAYKRHDAFQREIGFAPCTHNGCGAVIYMPDGSLLPVQNIQLAAKVLTALRADY